MVSDDRRYAGRWVSALTSLFSELSEKEREIVFHGPPEKKHILYKAKNSNQAAEMDFTYYNAVYTVEKRAGEGQR